VAGFVVGVAGRRVAHGAESAGVDGAGKWKLNG
jgi:hypothetical protein